MDVVICGGGITLFEVMAMGLPSLAFANEPHEELTIRYFQSRGGCGSIGAQTDMDERLLTTRLSEYLDNVSIINSFSSSSYKRFLEDGTSNTLQAILNL
jgi:UDP-N-acetylglucosamine:LPS N-acetylglucosamine transferase